jgi:endonuclease/exonuclease/phosphatase family metal-dependent hydrolase
MQKTFRVLTANLMAGGADARALVALVRREQPDLAAFQELGPEQAGALEAAGVFRSRRLDARGDGNGLGMAARHPAEFERLLLPGRDGWVASVRPEEAPGGLEVLNVHLTPPHHLPPWSMLAARRAQIAALRRHLLAPTPQPRILVGDLNSTPIFPAYRALTERLADAALLHAAVDGGVTYPTWAPRPGWRRLLRLDHVLVDPRLRVAGLRVADLPGSDHAALVVDLILPDGPLSAPGDRI